MINVIAFLSIIILTVLVSACVMFVLTGSWPKAYIEDQLGGIVAIWIILSMICELIYFRP